MTVLLFLTLLLLLLLLPLYVLYTIPHWFTALLAALNPRVTFFAPPRSAKPATRPKLIALTIDDAVDATVTQQAREAREVLRANGARATFFIIGQHCDSPQGRQALRDLVREGHELGNHTWLDRPSWKLGQAELKQEMLAVDALIRQAHTAVHTAAPAMGPGSSKGLTPPQPPPPAPAPAPMTKWFRPGHGFFTSAMLQTAEQLGYRTVLGNVYPHDPWVKSWRLNSWLVLQRTQPGSILILHDGRPWLIPTLREVLPRLTARGYSVVTLSELMQQYT